MGGGSSHLPPSIAYQLDRVSATRNAVVLVLVDLSATQELSVAIGGSIIKPPV